MIKLTQMLATAAIIPDILTGQITIMTMASGTMVNGTATLMATGMTASGILTIHLIRPILIVTNTLSNGAKTLTIMMVRNMFRPQLLLLARERLN